MENKYEDKLLNGNTGDNTVYTHIPVNTTDTKKPRCIIDKTKKRKEKKLTKLDDISSTISLNKNILDSLDESIQNDSIIKKAENTQQYNKLNTYNDQQASYNTTLIQPYYTYNQSFFPISSVQIYIPIPQFFYIQNPIDYSGIYNNPVLQTNYLSLQSMIINIQLINSTINRPLVIKMIDDLIHDKVNIGFTISNINQFLCFYSTNDINDKHLYFNNHDIKVLINSIGNSLCRADEDGTYILGKDSHGVALRRITHEGNIYFFHLDSQNTQNFLVELLALYPNSKLFNLNLDKIQQNPFNIKDLADKNSCAIWAYTNAIALSQMNLSDIIRGTSFHIHMPKINEKEVVEAPFKLIEKNKQIEIVEVVDVDALVEKENIKIETEQNDLNSIIDVDTITTQNEHYFYNDEINLFQTLNDEFDEKIFGNSHSKYK